MHLCEKLFLEIQRYIGFINKSRKTYTTCFIRSKETVQNFVLLFINSLIGTSHAVMYHVYRIYLQDIHMEPKNRREYTKILMELIRAWVLNRFSRIRVFATLWTVARQALLYMEFSRQEYWSGLPFPSPGDLWDPEIKPMSLPSPALVLYH